MELVAAAARLDQAVTASDFIDVATELIAQAGTIGAELYAVDHEVLHVVALGNPALRLPMTDAMLDSLMGQQTVHAAGSVWSPLPNRQQPFLVARIDASQPVVDRALGALIGELYAHRRMSRFDLERPRRSSAMSVAAELQWDILPMQTDSTELHAVAAALRPAYNVAGDAFDYELNEYSSSAYALDSMGHGTTATLAATLAVTALRNSRRAGASLAEQVTTAHNEILDEWKGSRFVTIVAVEATANSLMVVNAGHEPVRRRLVDGSIEMQQIPADPPAGTPHDRAYRTTELDPLQPGEGLVLLSDGAANNRAADGSSLGQEGVNLAIGTAWSAAPFSTVHRFLAEVNRNLDVEQVDDITALVLTA